MNDVASTSRYHSVCTSDSVMTIAVLSGDGYGNVFAQTLLHFFEVQISTVRYADIFRCRVLGSFPERQTLWNPFDKGVSGLMVAAMLDSQCLRHTSAVSPLRCSNECFPKLTLCFRVSCAGLACIVILCTHCNKMFFSGPDDFSPKSVDIYLMEGFLFTESQQFTCVNKTF